jgi:hypothetical protein
MAKRAIPQIPVSSVEHGRVAFDQAIKEVIEVITGRRGGQIQKLSADAGLSDVIAKVNEIIERLQ